MVETEESEMNGLIAVMSRAVEGTDRDHDNGHHGLLIEMIEIGGGKMSIGETGTTGIGLPAINSSRRIAYPEMLLMFERGQRLDILLHTWHSYALDYNSC